MIEAPTRVVLMSIPEPKLSKIVICNQRLRPRGIESCGRAHRRRRAQSTRTHRAHMGNTMSLNHTAVTIQRQPDHEITGRTSCPSPVTVPTLRRTPSTETSLSRKVSFSDLAGLDAYVARCKVAPSAVDAPDATRTSSDKSSPASRSSPTSHLRARPWPKACMARTASMPARMYSTESLLADDDSAMEACTSPTSLTSSWSMALQWASATDRNLVHLTHAIEKASKTQDNIAGAQGDRDDIPDFKPPTPIKRSVRPVHRRASSEGETLRRPPAPPRYVL